MENLEIKPYCVIGGVTLYKGDCLEIMPKLDMKIDCCITDPPYGTTACKWDSVIPFEPMWKELERLVKKEGAICLFGSEPFSSALRMSNVKMFKYDWIWVKNNAVGFVNAKLKPMNKHEIISIFSQGKTANCNPHNMVYYPQGLIPFGKMLKNGSKKGKENSYYRPSQKSVTTGVIQEFTNYPTTVLNFAKENKAIHPTQKPVQLIEYLIKTYTNEEEVVLDFTAGSGTTGIACMNTKRKCVLIEKEEKYCDIIVKRLQDRENELKQFLF